VARIAFAEPIDTRGRTRREVSENARERIASLLGLADTPPGRPTGR
jgi:hypothetical protein